MSSMFGNDEEWKLCVDWLVRCQLIPPNHHVTRSNAQFQDLAMLLRDGVLLCCLLNILQPGSVDSKNYSQNPQTSLFLYKRNVKTFLDACQASFGLKPSDLFDPFDLMEVSNFHSVIRALSLLSQSPRAVESNIKSFRLCGNNETTSPDYQNLSELTSDVDDDYYNVSDYSSIQRNQDEDIYGRLMDYVKSPPVTDVKPRTNADLCVKELVNTEESYLNVLKMIRDKFMKPLKPVLTPTDHNTIFRQIEKLHEVHTKFSAQLNAASSGDSRVTISDSFISFKEEFLIYGDFCTNLPKAQTLVEQLCKSNTQIKMAIARCEVDANDGCFKLIGLLVVPMQRILKYHLFLKELTKYHAGQKQWQKALAEIEDLSLFINEVKRDNEMLDNLSVIDASISGWLRSDNRTLKDYGRLQMDGELKLKGKKSRRHLFLLDQLILICTPHGDSFELESYLQVKLVKVESQVNMEKNMGFTFTIHKIDIASEVYVFGVKTAELANKWISAIQMALDNLRPEFARSDGHEFVMKSFSRPTICDVCRKLLRGTFFQGYTCLNTSKNVHKECIEKARGAEKPQALPKRNPSFTSQLKPGRPQTSTYVDVPAHSEKNSLPSPPPRKSEFGLDMSFSPCVPGNMDRAQAESILDLKPVGMFIIRPSARVGELALSINVGDSIRHVIISKSPEGQFYLKPNHKFSSLRDLVHHYQNNALSELSMTLGLEYRDGLSYCTAQYSYAATTPGHLSIREGDRITILNKNGESNGWWKGRIGSKVGYFPYAYVLEDSEIGD